MVTLWSCEVVPVSKPVEFRGSRSGLPRGFPLPVQICCRLKMGGGDEVTLCGAVGTALERHRGSDAAFIAQSTTPINFNFMAQAHFGAFWLKHKDVEIASAGAAPVARLTRRLVRE